MKQNQLKLMCNLAVFLMLAVLCSSSYAEIYKYIDDNGRTVYVDSEAKIPAKHLKKKISVDDRDRSYLSSDIPSAPKESAPTNAKEKRNRKQTTEVEIVDNKIFVDVEVAIGRRKVNLRLILDTGAQKTLIHERSVESLKGETEGVVFFKGASGAVSAAKMLKLSTLRVGPKKENDFTVSVIAYRSSKVDYDGLLGMDFLTKHQYEIDYENNMLIWK